MDLETLIQRGKANNIMSEKEFSSMPHGMYLSLEVRLHVRPKA
jgi:hypothetical protein